MANWNPKAYHPSGLTRRQRRAIARGESGGPTVRLSIAIKVTRVAKQLRKLATVRGPGGRLRIDLERLEALIEEQAVKAANRTR